MTEGAGKKTQPTHDSLTELMPWLMVCLPKLLNVGSETARMMSDRIGADQWRDVYEAVSRFWKDMVAKDGLDPSLMLAADRAATAQEVLSLADVDIDRSLAAEHLVSCQLIFHSRLEAFVDLHSDIRTDAEQVLDLIRKQVGRSSLPKYPTRHRSRTSIAVALLICGFVIGGLVGLSMTPIVHIVVSGALAAIGGVVAARTELGPSKSARGTAVPLAVLLAGVIIGAIAGIEARTHDLFAADPSWIAMQWKPAGLSDEQVAQRLFDQAHPPNSDAGNTAGFAGLDSVQPAVQQKLKDLVNMWTDLGVDKHEVARRLLDQVYPPPSATSSVKLNMGQDRTPANADVLFEAHSSEIGDLDKAAQSGSDKDVIETLQEWPKGDAAKVIKELLTKWHGN